MRRSAEAPAESDGEIAREVIDAVAALDARGHALADHETVAGEMHRRGLAPGRVREMHEPRELAKLGVIAELGMRLEEPASGL